MVPDLTLRRTGSGVVALRAFFDVRVFNPLAHSNRQLLLTCYRKLENLKKRTYKQRVQELERRSLVMSLTGGLGKAASVCYKHLALVKRDVPYSSTIASIIYSLSFSLLRSSIQCICGTRSNKTFQGGNFCLHINVACSSDRCDPCCVHA